MVGLSSLVKSTIPNYLSNLPIPDTFGGWFKLSFKDYLALIPPTAVVAGFGYISYLAFINTKKSDSGIVNTSIKKSEAKVVNMVDIENIADSAAFCRCWKSKNWPYCDGAHANHNKETGDNVGPVVIKRNK